MYNWQKQPIKSNLHTHTTFSDGKHSAEEVVLSAIAQGMEVIGFSEHSYNANPAVYGMKDIQTVEAYRAEIGRLQNVYGDRIRILLGIEQDSFGTYEPKNYDYVIGSVHYVYAGGEYCPVDHSRAAMEKAVEEHFGGDIYRYIAAYYEQVALMGEKMNCDIIGHFDLVTKFNEGMCMFDENSPRYLKPAVEALDFLIEKGFVLEVNTGAISRGYRKNPYPSMPLLRRISEQNGKLTVNSDSHHKDHLMFDFERTAAILNLFGLGRVLTMTPTGWKWIYV